MIREGGLRRRLEQALNQAYGDGLLSEQTYAWRLDTLLRSPVLDPGSLVGDLAVRRSPRGSGTIGRGLAALRHAPRRAAHHPVLPLLGLDWTGAVGELLVGRAAACDIRLGDISVSRHHADLRFRDGGWILRDVGSRNGTTVNGTAVVRCRLLPGDRVAFGDCCLLID